MKYVPAIVALLVVVATVPTPAAAYSGDTATCSEQKESLLEQIADYLGFMPSLGTTMKCVSAGAMWVGCVTVGATTIVAVADPLPDEVITLPATAMACGAANAQSMMCSASYASDAAKNAGQEATEDLQEEVTNSCSS